MKRIPAISLTSASVAVLCVSFLGFAASTFWLFDLFNHFRIQFLVASTVGLLLALVFRSKLSAWTFTLTALVNAALMIPLFLPQPDPPKSSREILIVSYNTWAHNGDWASILPILQADSPDIVYFTETHPKVQEGAYRLKADFHIFQIKDDLLLVRRRSKLNPKLIPTPANKGLAGIPVELSVDGVELTLLGIRPAAPLNSILTTSRDQSFAAITSFLENRKGLKILVGDFNATPWSRPFRILQEETGLVNSQKGFGIQSTWPSYPESSWNWLLRIPIDHCLHSPSIQTIDRRVGDHAQSNHNPIFVRLGIQTEARR